MKKSRRFLPLIIIITLTFKFVPLTFNDNGGTGDHSIGTKSSVKGYDFLTQGLFFAQDNENTYQRQSSAKHQALFGILSSLQNKFIVTLSSRRIHIDIRQKIKKDLSKRFYGSKYISNIPLS
jgi:hypothetical protein